MSEIDQKNRILARIVDPQNKEGWFKKHCPYCQGVRADRCCSIYCGMDHCNKPFLIYDGPNFYEAGPCRVYIVPHLLDFGFFIYEDKASTQVQIRPDMPETNLDLLPYHVRECELFLDGEVYEETICQAFAQLYQMRKEAASDAI